MNGTNGFPFRDPEEDMVRCPQCGGSCMQPEEEPGAGMVDICILCGGFGEVPLKVGIRYEEEMNRDFAEREEPRP